MASVKEREEAKTRILEENPDMPKDALEFVFSWHIQRWILPLLLLLFVKCAQNVSRNNSQRC